MAEQHGWDKSFCRSTENNQKFLPRWPVNSPPFKDPKIHSCVHIKHQTHSGMQISRASCHPTRATKFCTVALNIFSTIIEAFPLYKNVYQFTCTMQKATDNSQVHRSCQNCGFLEWNLLYVTFLAPKIWQWLLEICNICGCWTQSWAS